MECVHFLKVRGERISWVMVQAQYMLASRDGAYRTSTPAETVVGVTGCNQAGRRERGVRAASANVLARLHIVPAAELSGIEPKVAKEGRNKLAVYLNDMLEGKAQLRKEPRELRVGKVKPEEHVLGAVRIPWSSGARVVNDEGIAPGSPV